MFKPQGHNTLSPYLIVDDASAVLAFAKAVFDADPGLVHRNDAGDIHHAEVRIDDSILMIGQWAGATSSAHLHVYLPDVDAAFERAIAAGGTVVQQPAESGDGDRRGGIADSTGTTWWLSTHIS